MNKHVKKSKKEKPVKEKKDKPVKEKKAKLDLTIAGSFVVFFSV